MSLEFLLACARASDSEALADYSVVILNCCAYTKAHLSFAGSIAQCILRANDA